MNWLSFFGGVLVGWLIEWLIDVLYWRRRDPAVRREEEILQVRLEQAESRVRELQEQEAEWKICHQRLAEAEATIERLEAELSTVDAGLVVKAPEVEIPDADLDIEGRGLDLPDIDLPDIDLREAIEELKAKFPDIDIDEAFDDLRAKIPDIDLDGTIDGLRAKFPDVDIDGAFDGIKAKLPHLGIGAAIGGLKARFADKDVEVVEPPTEPVQRQDLRKIEGIGPKISRLLHDGGILSFAQLAETRVDRLQEILDAAGPNYQLADPETWPQQAKLAAAGDWQALEELKDQLIGGRTRRFHDGKPAAE